MPVSYEILGLLGEGSSGKLFRALLHGEGGFRKEVALRILPRERATADVLSRLREEARLLGALGSSGVVACKPPVETPLGWAVEMDWVDGISLDVALRAGLPPTARVEVIAEVARTLRDIHQAADDTGASLALVHRDVQPTSILISRTGAVRLLASGLARRTRPGASDLAASGAPAFLAPERAAGHDLPPGDVFSLGRTLTSLFVPTDSADWRALIDPAALPASVRELARSMTAFHPRERPSASDAGARARAVARELEGPRLREWAEAHVADLQRPPAADAWVGRRIVPGEEAPVRTWPWVGLALLLLGVLVGVWWSWPRVVPALPETGAAVLDIRRGKVEEGTAVSLHDLVVSALEEDGFWASYRTGAIFSRAALWVPSPPVGLELADRVDVQGTVFGVGITDARWVRRGRAIPIRPFAYISEEYDDVHAWVGVLVAVYEESVAAIEGDRIVLESGAVFDLGAMLPPELAVGDQIPWIAGVAHQEEGDLVMVPRGPEDIRLAPLPETVTIEQVHRADGVRIDRPLTIQDAVVTAIARDGHALWFQDPRGGPLSGLYGFGDPDLSGVSPGDRVTLRGNVRDWLDSGTPREADAKTELTMWNDGVSGVTVTGRGPDITPEPVDAAALVSHEEARFWHGMLITVAERRVVAVDPEHQEYLLEGGLRLGQRVWAIAPPLEPGQTLDSVTGVLLVGDGRVVLMPRSAADLVRETTGG